MGTKILHWLGVLAAITLLVSCFLPWAYYADINETFTGFYSYKNNYGKPGKFLMAIAISGLVFTLLPKVWAKRVNLFLAALGLGYAIKTYVLFTSCYNAYCPQKLTGIYVMLIASAVLLISTVFPNLTLGPKKD
ncbi:MAG: hypothetical protein IPP48_11725 [Chitinophagaceae bacterium]|nr:hypothetical protein [Chitinophagaceae bacterium]